MNETCSTFRDMLSAFTDGELEPADAARVRAHLLSCEACRETVAAYAAVDQAVLAVGSTRAEAEWQRLADRIDAAVVRQPLPNAGPLASARAHKRRWSERLGPRGLSLALGSAGTLLAAVLVVLFRPLSEDLVPVDTVPPLGRTIEEMLPSEETLPSEGVPVPVQSAVEPETESKRMDLPQPGAVTMPEVKLTPAAPPARKEKAEPAAVAEKPGAAAEEPSPAPTAAPPPLTASKTMSLSQEGAAANDALPEAQTRSAAPRSEFAAGRATAPRSEAELLLAVEETEAQLAEHPEGTRGVESASSLVTLWAELVALDADRYCPAAASAVERWESLASPDAAAAPPDAVRRIREACPE